MILICFSITTLSLQAQVDVEKLYNQAQMAVEMGYLDDAIDMYLQILKSNPKFAKGYLELGNIYLKKGENSNSIKNAISYFSQYLQVNPNAEDKETVKTTLDKLEYAWKKISQKEDNREFLQGRWASTDGKTEEYKQSSFILDMEEFDDKMKITIEPTSLLYSDEFTTKTVYIDNPNADQYVFTFTNDNTYIPSQAGYNFTGAMINQSTGGYRWGNAVGGVLHYFNDKAREKDVSKKTLTVYELKLNPNANKNNELECKVRMYIEETTPAKRQIILDETSTISFYKVPRTFVNSAPITMTFGGKLGNIDVLRNHPDPKISKMYKGGETTQKVGAIIIGLGLGTVIGGWIFGSKELEDAFVPIMIGGAGLTVIGIPITIIGYNKSKKAAKLHNEYLKMEKSKTSELRLGVSNNGVGLTYNF